MYIYDDGGNIEDWTVIYTRNDIEELSANAGGYYMSTRSYTPEEYDGFYPGQLACTKEIGGGYGDFRADVQISVPSGDPANKGFFYMSDADIEIYIVAGIWVIGTDPYLYVIWPGGSEMGYEISSASGVVTIIKNGTTYSVLFDGVLKESRTCTSFTASKAVMYFYSSYVSPVVTFNSAVIGSVLVSDDPESDGEIPPTEPPVPLPQVNKPQWAGYSLTWQDVDDATSYKVRLYQGGVVTNTLTVAPGQQMLDLSSVFAIGAYTATVQASEEAIT